MIYKVKNLQGKTYDIELDEDSTVGDLRAHIRDREGFDHYKLRYEGKLVHPIELKLSVFKIPNEG